jgi:hypothetical protein
MQCLFGDVMSFWSCVIVSWCNVTFCNRAVCNSLLHRSVPFVSRMFMIFIACDCCPDRRAIVCMMYQLFNFIGRKENKQNVWSLCHGAACMPLSFVTWTCIICLCSWMLHHIILIVFAKRPSGTMHAELANTQVMQAGRRLLHRRARSRFLFSWWHPALLSCSLLS